jgi:hypothetical protein
MNKLIKDTQQSIISTMFPEKIHFENKTLRTGPVNEIANYIYQINSELNLNKKEDNSEKGSEIQMPKNAYFEPGNQEEKVPELYLNYNFSINKKGRNRNQSISSCKVGKTGFEPATPWSQTRCATGLRHFPIRY